MGQRPAGLRVGAALDVVQLGAHHHRVPSCPVSPGRLEHLPWCAWMRRACKGRCWVPARRGRWGPLSRRRPGLPAPDASSGCHSAHATDRACAGSVSGAAPHEELLRSPHAALGWHLATSSSLPRYRPVDQLPSHTPQLSVCHHHEHLQLNTNANHPLLPAVAQGLLPLRHLRGQRADAQASGHTA